MVKLYGDIKRLLRLALCVSIVFNIQFSTFNYAEGQKVWRLFVDWLTEGSDVDSTYIYQRPARFQVSLDGSLQHVSVDLRSDFAMTCYERDDDGNITATAEVPSVVTSKLSENINGGMGMGFAFGKLGLGFGLITWPANAATTTAANIGYQGHKWGIGLKYYGISQHVANTLTVGSDTSQWYSYREFLSDNPCTVRRLAVDAYWSISRSRFAYTAAYKCDMVQRRSAGSMLICAGMVFSGLEHEQGDVMFSLSRFNGYTSFQSSVGAGYSHNFVLKHRDPVGPASKGLFNLTLNLTIMPMIIYANNINATLVDGGDKVRITGEPAPNINGSAALGCSVGRWFFGLQYRHNMAYFNTAEPMNASELGLEGGDVDNVSVSGLMQDWRLSTVVVFNF